MASLLVSCRESDPAPAHATNTAGTNVQIYSVTGVVRELKPDGKTVVIQHEAVTNYMPAMTMPFEVKDPRELAGLQPGDQVTFRMLVAAKEGWIDQIEKTGANDGSVSPASETFRRVREVEPLNVGDLIPDYPLTNELGQAFSLSRFKGDALGLTFIFTRCPFPNFCPRMSSNFQEVSQKLTAMKGGPTNWHLLSISFDPEFDTPATLKAYAESHEYDTAHWSFASGAMIEIDAITEQFGLMFPRNGTGFDHNLRTVVIDAKGRVKKIFIGNEWKVDDFVAEMVEAARTP